MAFVTAQPDLLASAAGRLQEIGSALAAQKATAAPPTTGLMPAAADEVSVLTAARFAGQAELYQEVSAQAVAMHDMFVATLRAGAGSYAGTEAANAAAVL